MPRVRVPRGRTGSPARPHPALARPYQAPGPHDEPLRDALGAGSQSSHLARPPAPTAHPWNTRLTTPAPILLHPFLSQNRRNTSQRVELMKYNPYLRKHTLHRELKK